MKRPVAPMAAVVRLARARPTGAPERRRMPPALLAPSPAPFTPDDMVVARAHSVPPVVPAAGLWSNLIGRWHVWCATTRRRVSEFDPEMWRAVAERNLLPSLAVVAVLGALVGLYSVYGDGVSGPSVAATLPTTGAPPAVTQGAHTVSGVRAIYEAPGLDRPPPPPGYATFVPPWDPPGTATSTGDPTHSAIDALTLPLTQSHRPVQRLAAGIPTIPAATDPVVSPTPTPPTDTSPAPPTDTSPASPTDSPPTDTSTESPPDTPPVSPSEPTTETLTETPTPTPVP